MNLLREKLRCSGHHLAQFGGSSSSASNQTTIQEDNRITNGTNGIVAQGGSSVSVLDGGAIQNAFTFADKAFSTAIAGNGAAAKGALDFAKSSQGQALDSLNTTSELVKDAYADAKGRGALTDKILIGAIAMAGVVAVMAVRK